MRYALSTLCLVAALGGCTPNSASDGERSTASTSNMAAAESGTDPQAGAASQTPSTDDAQSLSTLEFARRNSLSEDGLPEGYGIGADGNDPDIPDHPLGGEDFQPYLVHLPFIYEFKRDPEFCDGLRALDYEAVGAAMERAGLEARSLETRIRQMICMSYYHKTDRAALAAHRMLARLDTSDDLGMALAGPKVERKARFYAILTLATSRAGPDKLAAWRAAKARGWESAYAKGTDLDRIASKPTTEWLVELGNVGRDDPQDMSLRYNYDFWKYFGKPRTAELEKTLETERIAAGIPPQSITPKPDSYFRALGDVRTNDE